MTLMEWQYKQGWIWISENDGVLSVWIDPTDFDNFYRSLTPQDWRELHVTSGNIHNIMANCEAPEGCAEYEQVIHEWNKLGSPRIDGMAPSYIPTVWTAQLNGLDEEHERQAAWIEENPEELFEGVN